MKSPEPREIGSNQATYIFIVWFLQNHYSTQKSKSTQTLVAEFLVVLCIRAFKLRSPVTWGWPTVYRRRPSMHYHSRLCITKQMAECYWLEESSQSNVGNRRIYTYITGTERRDQCYNILTIWAMGRTSAQPQVNLSLLCCNSLKF